MLRGATGRAAASRCVVGFEVILGALLATLDGGVGPVSNPEHRFDDVGFLIGGPKALGGRHLATDPGLIAVGVVEDVLPGGAVFLDVDWLYP